jgi:riboflavin kinase / FMN adenylyltransferase
VAVFDDFSDWPSGTLFVAVGVFDGVHRGHQELIRRTVERAHERGARAVTTTFDPLPIQVLAPGAPPFALSDLDERTGLLHEAGTDDVVVFHFDRTFAAMAPDEFIRRVTAAGEVRQIVVGEDFQFGHDRAGNVRTLIGAGPTYGFEVFVATPFRMDGEIVSSTRVRNALLAGDVTTAARLLGRPYTVRGSVAAASVHGRGLGFPTIDIVVPPSRLLPRDGIYAMTLRLGEAEVAAAASVGVRPTEHGADRALEAFVLDAATDLHGNAVEGTFVKRLRDEVRFATPVELSEQIARDVKAAREALG